MFKHALSLLDFYKSRSLMNLGALALDSGRNAMIISILLNSMMKNQQSILIIISDFYLTFHNEMTHFCFVRMYWNIPSLCSPTASLLLRLPQNLRHLLCLSSVFAHGAIGDQVIVPFGGRDGSILLIAN